MLLFRSYLLTSLISITDFSIVHIRIRTNKNNVLQNHLLIAFQLHYYNKITIQCFLVSDLSNHWSAVSNFLSAGRMRQQLLVLNSHWSDLIYLYYNCETYWDQTLTFDWDNETYFCDSMRQIKIPLESFDNIDFYEIRCYEAYMWEFIRWLWIIFELFDNVLDIVEKYTYIWLRWYYYVSPETNIMSLVS